MSNEPSPRYDSFVIRVWQEATTGRLLRAEVDHVQSGAVHVGRGTGLAWIQTTLHKVLGAESEGSKPDEAESSLPPHVPDG
jgi:hypothetical protein